jgi:SAM-dependent methyltransferase
MILDLGCGLNKTPKSIGIDNVDLEGVDLVYDLNCIPYPYNKGTIDKIIMNDIIEHLDDPIAVIRECHRILKEGSVLFIKVVYFSHRYAWGDPQHKHAFSEVYFTHFLKKHTRSYCYDFHFSELNVEFLYQDREKTIIQGMKIELIK